MMVLYLDNLRQRLGLVDLLGLVPFRSAVCVPARLALWDSVGILDAVSLVGFCQGVRLILGGSCKGFRLTFG